MGSRLLDAISIPAFDTAERFIVRRSDERAERIGERMALLAFRADRKHRHRTIQNLELAFPEWSDSQRMETAKGVFRHFGRMWVQFMRTPARTAENVRTATDVVGLEHLEAAEALGKGVMYVGGHFGSWEWLSNWIAASGRKLTIVQRDANQSGINDRMVALRKAAGIDVISRGAAARGMLVRLKRNEGVGLLVDQNAGDIFVPFFGKPAGTVTGPAVIFARTGAPIVPVCAIWVGPGRYRVEIAPQIVATPGEEPVESITRALNANLEGLIRRYPEQYLWMHDRWKSARRAGML